MTFLNDFLKKIKSEPLKSSDLKLNDDQNINDKEVINKKTSDKQTTEKTPLTKTQGKTELTDKDAVLDAFQESEIEELQSESIIANLRALKELVEQPKEEKPELRFSKIKQHLGTPECHETIRQERWHIHIHCPKCRSTNLKRIAQLSSISSHNHRYLCLDCDTEFNDDSGTPLEKGVPPINVWMQCWYLLGCTDSISYIAHKLGLDIHIVELMIRQLQKTFNAKKPLTRFAGYAEWSKQTQELRKQLREDLLKQYERLDADVSFVPKDSEEHRRQQIKRRTLSTDTTDPTAPSRGKKL